MHFIGRHIGGGMHLYGIGIKRLAVRQRPNAVIARGFRQQLFIIGNEFAVRRIHFVTDGGLGFRQYGFALIGADGFFSGLVDFFDQ